VASKDMHTAAESRPFTEAECIGSVARWEGKSAGKGQVQSQRYVELKLFAALDGGSRCVMCWPASRRWCVLYFCTAQPQIAHYLARQAIIKSESTVHNSARTCYMIP